jgi:hypothetical protein
MASTSTASTSWRCTEEEAWCNLPGRRASPAATPRPPGFPSKWPGGISTTLTFSSRRYCKSYYQLKFLMQPLIDDRISEFPSAGYRRSHDLISKCLLQIVNNCTFWSRKFYGSRRYLTKIYRFWPSLKDTVGKCIAFSRSNRRIYFFRRLRIILGSWQDTRQVRKTSLSGVEALQC